MVVDYSRGKVYKIWSPSTELIYVGSTTQLYLSNRMSGHRSDYKCWMKGKYHYVSSFKILEFGDARIELIELFPCASKEELLKREGEWIRKLDCVNKCVAGNMIGRDMKEYKQEYYQANQDKIKEYYQANQDKIKEYNQEYYQANQDKIKEYKQEYYQANQDKFKEYKKANQDKFKEYKKKYYQKAKQEKIECECGQVVSKISLKSHQKSAKHQKLMKARAGNSILTFFSRG